MFLLDTNVFLEILLNRDKKEDCKNFLSKNTGNLHITDFSLHSIGVVLFRYSKSDIFNKFINDILPNIYLISLPVRMYRELINSNKQLNLDFDDAYQYANARYHRLKMVTMDKHFERVGDLKVLFL